MNWYLIYTKPREELRAKRNLEQQQYEVYLPMVSQPAKANAQNARRLPLFPRYIFLGVDELGMDLSGVRNTRGVVDFVRFGAALPTVSEEVMESVRASEEYFSRHCKSENKAVCERQRYELPFVHRKSSERVVLLINSLGEEACPSPRHASSGYLGAG